jgi:hypothetical protein
MPRAEGREMEDDLDSAARYLERAEEVRAIAANMMDERTRNALLKIAEDYIQMAQTRSEIHALGQTVKAR